MSTYYQNRTGYDGSGEFIPNNYYNEYNKTNALHLKYQNMNQTEVPQMKFANRQGSLNLNLIKKLDLNYVIKTNNIIPLEKLSQNLIYSEIKDEDYEDQNIPKLLRTFQYALEYLNEKQSKLEATNNKLNLEYNQLINQSYELEEKLKINKRQIAKNSSDKKEREMILITYESIVNFNCNPIENTNLIYNNLNANYGEYTSNENMGMDRYTGSTRGRFYCHICNGKYFKTELGLENHMKKRHEALMEKKSKEEEEKKREEEIKEYYDKKIEETRSCLQNMIQQKNNELFYKTNNEDEIKRIKRDNELILNNIINKSNNNTEEMKNFFQTFINNQEENNRNIMNLAKATNKERENNEPQKIIIENQSSNEINKLTNSISQLGELIKYHYDRNNNDMHEQNKILRNKIEILENRSKFVNLQNNLNNQYDKIYSNQNNNTPNNDFNPDNFSNNNIPNNYINIGINQKSNNNLSNNNIPGTNIINDNGHNPESNNYYIPSNNIKINQTLEKNSQVPNQIQREKKKDNDYQDPNEEDKKIINTILSESINPQNNNQQININNNPYNQNNQNNQDNTNTHFCNTADNFYNNNNVIKIHQEENPYLNKQKNINNFNKTEPMLFKKRNYKPLQLKKDLSHSGSMKELDLFYKNFMDRDQPIYQPILVNKKPKAQEYLKEIIPPDKKIETTDEFIENRIKNKTNKLLENFENNDKKELMNAIEKTMENINEINNKNQVSQFYYEIAQKAFDLKLLEEDEKMMRNAYDNKGVLKRSRSSSRAKITIQQSENENFY